MGPVPMPVVRDQLLQRFAMKLIPQDGQVEGVAKGSLPLFALQAQPRGCCRTAEAAQPPRSGSDPFSPKASPL
jgi:hypothetical protein